MRPVARDRDRFGPRDREGCGGLLAVPEMPGRHWIRQRLTLPARFNGLHAPRLLHSREVHQTAHHRSKKLAAENFERFPRDRYLTEVESRRHLRPDNIEFTMKRVREPIENVA